MRIIINKILVILLLSLCSVFSMWSQNDYARHLEIMSQANTLVGDKKIDEAMSICVKIKTYSNTMLLLYLGIIG